LPSERAKPGTKIEVDIRGKRVAAEVVKLPFVPHRTKK
jgi:glycine cleavage system aminomethyltransferase T